MFDNANSGFVFVSVSRGLVPAQQDKLNVIVLKLESESYDLISSLRWMQSR